MAVFFSRFPRTARGPQVLDATDARQGRWGRHLFWVLVASTMLAVIALFGAWAFHADELATTSPGTTYAEAQASGGHETSPRQLDSEDPAPTPR